MNTLATTLTGSLLLGLFAGVSTAQHQTRHHGQTQDRHQPVTLAELIDQARAQQADQHAAQVSVSGVQSKVIARILTADGEETFEFLGDDPRIMIAQAQTTINDAIGSEAPVRFFDAAPMPRRYAVIRERQETASVASTAVRGPAIGVAMSTPPQALLEHFDLDAETTVMVAAVSEDSPAARAGLRPFDLIVLVDGEPATPERLVEAVRDAGADKAVRLRVISKGDTRNMRIRPRDGVALPEVVEMDEPVEGSLTIERRFPMQERGFEGQIEFLERRLGEMPNADRLAEASLELMERQTELLEELIERIEELTEEVEDL